VAAGYHRGLLGGQARSSTRIAAARPGCTRLFPACGVPTHLRTDHVGPLATNPLGWLAEAGRAFGGAQHGQQWSSLPAQFCHATAATGLRHQDGPGTPRVHSGETHQGGYARAASRPAGWTPSIGWGLPFRETCPPLSIIGTPCHSALQNGDTHPAWPRWLPSSPREARGSSIMPHS
jgi:hypothetical protein